MKLLSPSFLLCALYVISLVAWGIVFVVFSLITVRRLRRNPCTRNELGLDFMPGQEVLSVAQALTLPKRFSRLLRRGELAALFADPDLLLLHTRPVDRWLGRACYVLMYVVCLLLVAAGFAIRQGPSPGGCP